MQRVVPAVFADRPDARTSEVWGCEVTLRRGEYCLFEAESGAGKSSLCAFLYGLRGDYAGRILFDGTDITDMGITERARMGISYGFQQPVRFKGVTVLDLIRLAAGKNISTAGACGYLSEVGLCARDYINREVNASLSGGELQFDDRGYFLCHNSAPPKSCGNVGDFPPTRAGLTPPASLADHLRQPDCCV